MRHLNNFCLVIIANICFTQPMLHKNWNNGNEDIPKWLPFIYFVENLVLLDTIVHVSVDKCLAKLSSNPCTP